MVRTFGARLLTVTLLSFLEHVHGCANATDCGLHGSSCMENRCVCAGDWTTWACAHGTCCKPLPSRMHVFLYSTLGGWCGLGWFAADHVELGSMTMVIFFVGAALWMAALHKGDAAPQTLKAAYVVAFAIVCVLWLLAIVCVVSTQGVMDTRFVGPW
jgi:hypothetical protein